MNSVHNNDAVDLPFIAGILMPTAMFGIPGPAAKDLSHKKHVR